MRSLTGNTIPSAMILGGLLLILAGCMAPASVPASATLAPTLVSLSPQATAVPPTTVEATAMPTTTPMASPTPTLPGVAAVIAPAPAGTPAAEPTSAPTLAPGARISIPALSLDAPLVATSWHIEIIDGEPVAVWDTPDAMAGHHRGSALPGQPGNCVISGHSRSEQGGVFYGLWDLAVGDEIVVQDESGRQFRYQVAQTATVPELGEDLATRQSNAVAAMAPSDDERLTLITCWPDWAYTHRLVVVARPLG